MNCNVKIPIGPSAIPIKGKALTPNGWVPYVIPKEATSDDIKYVIEDYRKAAENATRAGFDGIELHGGTGFLID